MKGTVVSASLYKRLLLYVTGLIIYAFGACLMVTARVGISPLTSVAYILSRITPFSLGVTQLIFNAFLILLQALILRKNFHPYEYLQFAASILFSVFIDLQMLIVKHIYSDAVIIRCLLFGGSMICMAWGLVCMLQADFVMLPGDGLPKVIAKLTKWRFGTAKVISDSLCAVSTIVISLIFLGRIEGVHAGTIVAAIAIGSFTRLFTKIFGNAIGSFINKPKKQQNTRS
jgi:uncharacterized membrane protein YczE